MAITKDEIFRAADELTQAGQAPTYLAVRGKLGSGSFGTLQKYLRQWRDERQRTDASGASDGRAADEAIPERFQALAERLARDAWTIAKGDIDSAVNAVRAQADEEIAEARSEAEAAGHTVDALQGTLEELRAELERVHAELAASKEEAAHTQGEKARLEEMVRGGEDTLRRVTGELTLARERVGRLEAEVEAGARELHAAQVRHQELKRERDEAKDEITQLRSEGAALREKGSELALALQEVQIDRKNVALRLGETMKERQDLQENLQKEKEAHRGTRTELEGAIYDLSTELHTVKGLRGSEQERLESTLEQNRLLEKQIRELTAELRDVSTERATLAERLQWMVGGGEQNDKR